jgi:hypothetical protein
MDKAEAIKTLETCLVTNGCETCTHSKEDCNDTVLRPVIELLKQLPDSMPTTVST